MYYLIFFNFVIVASVFWIARSHKFAGLKGSVFNPLVFVSFINFFFILDFYYLYNNPEISFYETNFVILESYIDEGFVIFTMFNFVFAICVVIATFCSKLDSELLIKPVLNKKAANRAFRLTVCLAFLIAILNYDLYLSMFSGQISRQILFSSNPLYHIIFSLILPTFALYSACLGTDKKRLIKAYLLTLLVIFLSGSRGNIILATIIFIIAGFPVIRRLPSYLLFVAIPVVTAFLLVTRYYLREVWYYSSIADFVNDYGGVGQVFFNSTEISMAEVLVTISLWKEQLVRYPFESFVGGLMYPLPRSIFEFKPVSPGGVLTDLLSPTRWELTRSEIVTTGYGDLLMQFGIAGALIVFSVMTFFWVKLVIATLKSSLQYQILLVPFLIWWPYVFLRADVFNMFGNLWSFFLAIFIYRVLSLHTKR
jgi:hypothetical protein